MEWKISDRLVEYPEALAVMAERVAGIQQGTADELVWMVEHPPLYTLGTSAKAGDVLAGGRFPTYETGRGGQVTYHGPGQLVAYVMRDLKRHAGPNGPDLRAYVQQLEQWIIVTLAAFGIEGCVREGRVGVWVDPVASRQSSVASGDAGTGVPFPNPLPQGERAPPAAPCLPNSEAKIAALGVRVQKWVTSHGIALNVAPDLSHYAGIVPCGIREFGVTSLQQMGVDASMVAVQQMLQQKFAEVFSR